MAREAVTNIRTVAAFGAELSKPTKSAYLRSHISGFGYAGKSLAVVGPSGSGKSIVIGLIMRFYDPNNENLCIDGQNIKTLNLRSLRKKLALVQQEPVLFSTTIHENIKYGNEKASEAEIIELTKAANAHEFISRT